jgi:hypothetical protein
MTGPSAQKEAAALIGGQGGGKCFEDTRRAASTASLAIVPNRLVLGLDNGAPATRFPASIRCPNTTLSSLEQRPGQGSQAQAKTKAAQKDFSYFSSGTNAPRAQCKPYRAPVVRLEDDSMLTVEGRDACALSRLVHAGEHGCTPINNPVPRWSHYVWEAHSGAYAGHHARYVFRNALTVIDEVRRAASPC